MVESTETNRPPNSELIRYSLAREMGWLAKQEVDIETARGKIRELKIRLSDSDVRPETAVVVRDNLKLEVDCLSKDLEISYQRVVALNNLILIHRNQLAMVS